MVWRDRVPRPLSQCSLLASQQQHARDHTSDARLRIDAKVLVIVESAYSRLGRDNSELLVANRIRGSLGLTVKKQYETALRTLLPTALVHELFDDLGISFSTIFLMRLKIALVDGAI
ncbi:unnamed protein product [Parnassius apollo]|uniref:(apollo) hypothetical protein n=1 Tax=Parnassius apollo TaxID=110799 RepID=A0A8S3W5A8_PARAO|nr:unnamed protein product [Parnassius apollo]